MDTDHREFYEILRDDAQNAAAKLVSDVRSVEDPAQRVEHAKEALARLTPAVDQLIELRKDAARELLAGGMSAAEVARRMGVSRQMAGKALGTAKERTGAGA